MIASTNRYKLLGVALAAVLIGCGTPPTSPAPSSSSGVSSSSASAGSSSSSSSSGSGDAACPGERVLLAPILHDNGLPYWEARVHACRRFGPGTYTEARIAWRTEGVCTEEPEFRWSLAAPNASKEADFSFTGSAFVPPDGILPMAVTVPEGQALFVCVLLTAPELDRRACIEGCRFEYDPDSFWGNTGPDGYLLNPMELEPLSVSPTVGEAQAWANDKTRLLIDAVLVAP